MLSLPGGKGVAGSVGRFHETLDGLIPVFAGGQSDQPVLCDGEYGSSDGAGWSVVAWEHSEPPEQVVEGHELPCFQTVINHGSAGVRGRVQDIGQVGQSGGPL